MGVSIGLATSTLANRAKKFIQKSKDQQELLAWHQQVQDLANKRIVELENQVNVQAAECEEMVNEGYNQAYEIIADLRARLEQQRQEIEQQLKDEEAYRDSFLRVRSERP